MKICKEEEFVNGVVPSCWFLYALDCRKYDLVFDSIEEIEFWCEENIDHKWGSHKYHDSYEYDDNKSGQSFYFENELDAIAFKLKWYSG